MMDGHRDGCQCHGCICSRYELEINSLTNDIEHERETVRQLTAKRDALKAALETIRKDDSHNPTLMVMIADEALKGLK